MEKHLHIWRNDWLVMTFTEFSFSDSNFGILNLKITKFESEKLNPGNQKWNTKKFRQEIKRQKRHYRENNIGSGCPKNIWEGKPNPF